MKYLKMQYMPLALALFVPLLLADEPPDARDWLVAGFGHAKAGEFEKERAAYRQALRLDPGLTEAHGALAMSNYTAKNGSIDTVVTEIRAYLESSPHREHLERAIAEIVETYVDRKVMPLDPVGDALHLAVASYHRCDFLLTWNCRHLANANKFDHIRRVNTMLGLFVPALVTPLELLGDADDDECR